MSLACHLTDAVSNGLSINTFCHDDDLNSFFSFFNSFCLVVVGCPVHEMAQ
eukprot:m.214181 g.214181  ORF g.214181 m.214181 type:complete len:51 (-) comp16961_c0_seq27:219-371(-)